MILLKERQILQKSAPIVHGHLVGKAIIADLLYVLFIDEVIEVFCDVLCIFLPCFVGQVIFSLGAGKIDGGFGPFLHLFVILGKCIHMLPCPIGESTEGTHKAGRDLAVALTDLLIEMLAFNNGIEHSLVVMEAEAAEIRRKLASLNFNVCHILFSFLFLQGISEPFQLGQNSRIDLRRHTAIHHELGACDVL